MGIYGKLTVIDTLVLCTPVFTTAAVIIIIIKVLI